MDYLRNQKTLKPFPKLGAVAYPGVQPPGAKLVDSIDPVGATGGKSISVAPYEKDRGGLMPAIYIARNTHRADVHIHGELSDDNPDSPGRHSPGATIDNWFRSAFRSAVGISSPHLLDSEASMKLIAAAGTDATPVPVKGGIVSRGQVNAAILAAARSTYQSIKSDTRPRLERAILDQEVEYYKLIAERYPGKQTLSLLQAAAAYKTVTDKDDTDLGGTAGLK
jgi:hypothetical protein